MLCSNTENVDHCIFNENWKSADGVKKQTKLYDSAEKEAETEAKREY
jgi:hypothetical protein